MEELPLFDEVFAALMAVSDDKRPETVAVVDGLRDRLAEKRRDKDAAEPVFPDLDAPDFHRRLQAMRSMYVMSSAEDALAGSSTRTLKPHQRFVKAYMSPGTGYNGLLLIHAVGWGKTCSAITVAEMYRTIMRKPALVLTKATVRAEFEKELGNSANAVWTPGGWTMPIGCGGPQYQRVVAMVKSPDRKTLREALYRITSKNYRFSGYEEFSNEAERLFSTGGDNAVRDAYSDRVIVVDEVHNLRSDDNSKRSSDMLERVLGICSNVKLLLLSATPMFDKPKEIVFLINLLRVNDGRPKVDVDEIFDGEGNLVSADKLEAAAQGYVSFVRGANFDDLPARIPGHEAMGVPKWPWPKKAYDGAAVKDNIENFEVFPCELKPDHAAFLRQLVGAEPENDEQEDMANSRLGPASQASNAVFKTPEGLKYGDQGIDACFVKEIRNGVAVYAHRDKSYRPLSPSKIRDHAPKLANIVDAVVKCEGISFVYTYWINGGAVPMALALEERGFTRVGGPMLKDGPSKRNAGSYVVLSGRSDLMNISVSDAITRAVAADNADGSKIKVIIGTSSVMEGNNFKCVRSVHVMDAWWNSARSEQIIGRAVRLASHAALPENKRNVSIFHHGAQLPGNVEGIDHYMYRKAVSKQKQVSDVLFVLRDTSVDCAWNREQLYKPATGSVAMRSSQGVAIKVPRGHRDGDPECFYSKCTKPCKHYHLLAPADTIKTLYAPLQDDVDVVKYVLQAAFLRRPRLRHEDIVDLFPGIESDTLDHCLSALLKEGARMNGSGRFALFGDVYVIDPVAARSPPVTLGAEIPFFREGASVDDLMTAFTEAGELTSMSGLDDVIHDAVVDRASVKHLVAKIRVEKFKASMKRGGMLQGSVIYHPGTGKHVNFKGRHVQRPDIVTDNFLEKSYVKNPWGINRPEKPAAIVDASGVFKLITATGQRECATLSHAAVLSSAKAHGVDLEKGKKRTMCAALELVLRKRGLVIRPGWA
jgi:hypothetical protein